MAPGSGGSLARYFLTRLVLVVPMLVILLTATFLLLRVAPGDPVTATLGDRVSEARVEAIRRSLGLDRPLWRQYVDYVDHVADPPDGLAAVAVPVRDERGMLLAALGLSGPCGRFDAEARAAALAPLRRTASALEALWAHPSSPARL